jgi:hypothetical protein
MFLFAQQDWKVNAQIRHRFEMDNKDFNSNTDFNNFSLLRSRLGITFNPTKNLNTFFQLQDSRVFGEETSTLGDGSADNIDVHQAYIYINNFFNSPVSIKLGRMEVIYGPQRLIGAVGWDNIGRSLDGIIFGLHFDNNFVDIFAFQEVEMSAINNVGDRSVFGIYSKFKPIESYSIQPFFIWQQENPSEILDRYTVGFYVKGQLGNFQHEVEYAYQFGTFNDMDVSALMAALNVGYTFSNHSLKPNISFGVDFISGDDDPLDNTVKVFDTIFATNHKFYGYMDYFLNIPVHTMGLGLVDSHLKLSLQLLHKTDMQLAYHFLKSHKEFMATDGSLEKGFGNEIDLIFKHKYNLNVSFIGGASLFSPEKIFKENKGEDNSTWLFLMTVVNL